MAVLKPAQSYVGYDLSLRIPSTRRTNRTRNSLPNGYYVYAWFKDDSDVPFYVGKGTGRRAWDIHVLGNRYGRATPASCQMIRMSCSNFRVRVLRDELTSYEAGLVESVIIDLLTRMGVVFSNQAGKGRM
jgi:hypothetical protein